MSVYGARLSPLVLTDLWAIGTVQERNRRAEVQIDACHRGLIDQRHLRRALRMIDRDRAPHDAHEWMMRRLMAMPARLLVDPALLGRPGGSS